MNRNLQDPWKYPNTRLIDTCERYQLRSALQNAELKRSSISFPHMISVTFHILWAALFALLVLILINQRTNLVEAKIHMEYIQNQFEETYRKQENYLNILDKSLARLEVRQRYLVTIASTGFRGRIRLRDELYRLGLMPVEAQ